jgi:hypothetical protein
VAWKSVVLFYKNVTMDFWDNFPFIHNNSEHLTHILILQFNYYLKNRQAERLVNTRLIDRSITYLIRCRIVGSGTMLEAGR